ncbi:tyrosine-type recombinase/integrase [Crocosphaera sp. UHCC 0190]|uniref:tyrosine-type recombinase/integrase n=1 Tax=Crocosphaera sp. UHCC 0190 TaxID=3110246 RepID=UPI002B210A8B|nr:tyrosine-type recombinase/integrase [Crocosphaera sp. UHCC 0190]MEA5511972.1 tyrosine-type recombinase/integrase [Crocosphaera sp. UHCC 0190]
MSNLVPLNPNLTHLTPLTSKTDWDVVLNDWLSTKRSPHTQRVYRKDIDNFLTDVGMSLGKFLSGDRFQGHELVTRYKGQMMTNNLTPSTINRRLAAIKSLVSHAYQCGHTEFTLETVKSEKMTQYRDTSGIDIDRFKDVLNGIERSNIIGVRDYALLVLLWSNALRRSEVAKANVRDFDPDGMTLRIFGKGRGTEAETVSLGKGTAIAITSYLEMRGDVKPNDPLFIAHKPGYIGHRLHTNSIYKVVQKRCEAAGIKKVMSPHRIRHSAITTALDKTDGDVRKVQKLSRHANLNTLMIYDDNRLNAQKDMTELLDSLI